MFQRVIRAGVVIAMSTVVIGLVVAIPDVAASTRCEPVSGSVTSTADFSNFTTRGTISGSLEGSTFFQGDPSSLAAVTATTSPALNPTDHYTGDFTVTTKKGVLKTRSVGVFELVGNGLGTQFDRVLGAQSTGKFAGATGQLFFNFQSDSSGTKFSSTYTGQICN
jgi:hypothetical protein